MSGKCAAITVAALIVIGRGDLILPALAGLAVLAGAGAWCWRVTRGRPRA
jgi:hypothetical protein